MPELYTISQESSWKAGDILSATKLDASGMSHSSAIDDEEIMDYLHHNFPEGLSQQGCNYLMDTSKNRERISLEVLFELVRQLKFPHRISRLNCLFGFETLDQVNKKNELLGNSAHTIYKIECSDYFRADRSLLRVGQSPIEEILLAEKYWKGLSSDNPVVECLVKFPVQITKELTTPVPIDHLGGNLNGSIFK